MTKSVRTQPGGEPARRRPGGEPDRERGDRHTEPPGPVKRADIPPDPSPGPPEEGAV
ncbi:hypothetical protein [Streptomyces sp. NPDC058867]|uniref:hypothetical protein n=1 Tax=unclassified Streptomyces TaxID=2593676 RepID=UPI0036B5C2AF